MSKLVLKRVIRTWDRGRDVRAVKRGLARAGHGSLRVSWNPVMGPLAVRRVKRFQRRAGLADDGVYGEDTHGELIQFFDAFARRLYDLWEPVQPAPPAAGSLQLPRDFAATHQTAGLPGFPAVDVFAHPDTVVLAPEDGVIDRLSGRDPSEGGSPGGPYGWSIYLDAASGRYFMTHFATRRVTVGQRVARGEAVGTVCDSAVSGRPGTSHIHLGKSAG